MTREELNRRRMMFQINANKNNLPKPEYDIQNPAQLRHSATNDYLEFRKKVAKGARMQKEAKVNMFNVTEANEHYRQELADKTVLIHAGTNGMTNAYVAKLDDFYGKGKPRYFYSRAEWDAYQRNQAQSNSSSNVKTNSREAAEKAAKPTEAQANKNITSAQNKDIATGAQNAFANAQKNMSSETYKAQSGRELAQKNSSDLKKKADPKDIKRADEIKADKERWAKYDNEEGNKALQKVISTDDRFKNIKTSEDAALYPGGPDKLYNDVEDAIKKELATQKNSELTKGMHDAYTKSKKNYDEYKKNEEASKNAGADRAKKAKKDLAKDLSSAFSDTLNNNEVKGKISDKIGSATKNTEDRQKKIIDAALKGNDVTAEDLASEYGVSKEYIRELVYNTTGKTVPTKSEIEEQKKKKAISGGSGNTKNSSSNKSSSGYTEFTLGEDGTTKKVKHSSEEDGITTSDAMTPEQEYLEFRKKVEAGLKHFGHSRGLITVPVNQALKNGESLSHAGYGGSGMTNKYYAKLDDFWGKGKPRYFYSKEEWDGYQKNKQGAGQAGSNRANKEKENASKIETKSYSEKKMESDIQNKTMVKNLQDAYANSQKNYNTREAAENRAKPTYTEASNKLTDYQNKQTIAGAQQAFANSQKSNDVKQQISNAMSNAFGNGSKPKQVTVIVSTNDGSASIPKIVEESQSARESAEKSATKRTQTNIAYDNAIKEYNSVVSEANKKYGFDKLDPDDKKAQVKLMKKMIKDTAEVIDSGKIDNPNNVVFDYKVDDDSASYAFYIQEYASELLRLQSIYNDLQNEYSKTLQTAQAMTDFNALKEANDHAAEVFNEMRKIDSQYNDVQKESYSKLMPYLTEIYKELL